MHTTHRTSQCSRNRLTPRLVAFTAAGAAALILAPIASPATTVIGVDGIKQLVPGGPNYHALDIDGGVFRNLPDSNVLVANNPRGFGILTDVVADGLAGGFNDPGYDQSKATAVASALDLFLQARAADPNGQVIFVGHSQGSDSLSELLRQLEASGVDTKNVTFVLTEDPDLANGGIKTRIAWLPPIFVPLLGVTVGGQQPTTSDHTKVIEVVMKGDGFADFPQYLFNVVAVANALAGMVYLHSQLDTVDIDPATNPNIDVTTTPNGMIEVRRITPELEPLLMAAESLGLPHDVALALNPLVTAIVETGYNRPDPTKPGTEPVDAVNATLLPPPSLWAGDLQSVSNGFQQTVQNLANLANPGAAAPQPVNQVPPSVLANLAQPGSDDSNVITPLAASQPSGGVQPQQFSAPVQQSLVQQQQDDGDDQQPVQQKGPELNVVRNSLNASSGSSSSSGSSVGTHTNQLDQLVNGTVKSFTDGVNNVVKTVQGALSPKPSGSTTSSGSPDSSDSSSASSSASSSSSSSAGSGS